MVPYSDNFELRVVLCLFWYFEHKITGVEFFLIHFLIRNLNVLISRINFNLLILAYTKIFQKCTENGFIVLFVRISIFFVRDVPHAKRFLF